MPKAEITPDVCGLTSREVEQRVKAGKVNSDTDVKTKTIPQIIAEHTFTLFNGVNVVLAALVIFTGEYRNLLFMGIVIANLIVGVVQEVRAKLTVDKLSVMTVQNVAVIRDHKRQEVPVSELVQDDIVSLSHGDQVPADAQIIAGSVTMDESLLTGEADRIEKSEGDEILSGSFVASGSLMARVTRVGKEGYAARLNTEAKCIKPIRSQIRDTLNMIVRFSTFLMPPLGVGLFLRSVFFEHMDINAAILSTVAALVSMIPQGLILLTSSVIAIATIRLGSKKVLIQQSYCVETLARVDTICLDKTGTITSGRMSVEDIVPLNHESKRQIESVCALIVRSQESDANETAKALLSYVEEIPTHSDAVRVTVPFSSERKYSGCIAKDGHAYVLGAGQFVMGVDYNKLYRIRKHYSPASRFLVVGEVSGFTTEGSITGSFRPFGLVVIQDEIRPYAADTIKYFTRQGVNVRVITGDDARTASQIAKQVGVVGADRCVDLSTIHNTKELKKVVRHKRIFGRVTPQQKRAIIEELQREGHTVAMTGDGVNDVLALKKADCSIAMASGSAATRNVAEVVLADNDFSHLPDIVAEGRRSINNLQRSASLFLVKTVFSIVLCLISIFFPPYPFMPIQISFISGLIIGYPSFVLALEPNHERLHGDFLVNVLTRSLPASISIVAAVVATMAAEDIFSWGFARESTLCVWLSCIVGIAFIYRISQPLTPLRIGLLVTVGIGVVGGSLLFGNFFLLQASTETMGIHLVLVGTLACILFNRLYTHFQHDIYGNGLLMRAVKKAEANYERHKGLLQRYHSRAQAENSNR